MHVALIWITESQSIQLYLQSHITKTMLQDEDQLYLAMRCSLLHIVSLIQFFYFCDHFYRYFSTVLNPGANSIVGTCPWERARKALFSPLRLLLASYFHFSQALIPKVNPNALSATMSSFMILTTPTHNKHAMVSIFSASKYSFRATKAASPPEMNPST